MLAVKDNRCYTINDADITRYTREGYDVFDENNKLIAYAAGKTIAYGKYLDLQKENEELKRQIAALEKEYDELKKAKKKEK